MALKAGYKGVKKVEADKLKNMSAIKEIGEGLTLGSDGSLDATGTTVAIEANPDGAATDDLAKLKIGDDIYAIPDKVTANPSGTSSTDLTKLKVGDTIYNVPGNDNSKCYQTDDATESAIVDADYIPFFDASAASGAGAPRKSTWANFVSKIQSKISGSFFPRSEQNLSSADDLNDVTTDGIYGIGTAPTNSPESTAYCILIVKRYSGDQLIQVIHKHDIMYSRRYFVSGDTPTWSNWYKFTGTIVNP